MAYIVIFYILMVYSKTVISVSKITGGSPGNIADFPYQVSLQTVMKGQIRHFCGGTILTEEWILTAAHCIEPLTREMRSNLLVVGGSTKLSEAAEKGQTVQNVGKYCVHPEYRPGVGPNDIAVFKVQPFQFNDNIKPANLPPPWAIYTGKATGSGWGSTRYFLNVISSDTPDGLRKATFDILDIDDCREEFGDDGYKVDEFGNICTEKQLGIFSMPSSMCTGDSGGPLSKSNTVIGIVSWGNKICGFFPSVFTRVAYYMDFIKEHVPIW